MLKKAFICRLRLLAKQLSKSQGTKTIIMCEQFLKERNCALKVSFLMYKLRQFWKTFFANWITYSKQQSFQTNLLLRLCLTIDYFVLDRHIFVKLNERSILSLNPFKFHLFFLLSSLSLESLLCSSLIVLSSPPPHS